MASTLARASNSLAKSDKEETAYSLRLIVHIQILQTDIHKAINWKTGGTGERTATFLLPFTFASSPLSESLEQAKIDHAIFNFL